MIEVCIFCFLNNIKCSICLKDRKSYYNRTYYIKKMNERFSTIKKCFNCKVDKPFEEFNGKRKHRNCSDCRKFIKKKYSKKYYNKYKKHKIIKNEKEIFEVPKKIILYIYI